MVKIIPFSGLNDKISNKFTTKAHLRSFFAENGKKTKNNTLLLPISQKRSNLADYFVQFWQQHLPTTN
ncbi:MAG: hypothetical protein IKW83_07490 [Muribaculaceae bacterium]|nr:hypothetical protein [Muribaculaceae bacterium]